MNWRTNSSHVISQGPCTASGCSSRNAKTHYSDGHAYCFSCNTYFPAEHRVPMAAPYDVMKPKTEAYPNRLEVNPFNCGKSYAWLRQYGLTDEEIEENFFFAPISDRHVFVCRDPDTNDEFFEARSPVKSITPKTLQYGTKPTLFMGDLTSEYLVVVEDVVSAIKVGRQAMTLPLFGSFFAPQQMAKIGRNNVIKHVVVWLDCDKFDKGMEYAKQMGFFKPSVAIQTLEDPKALDDETIVFTLMNALDTMEEV